MNLSKFTSPRYGFSLGNIGIMRTAYLVFMAVVRLPEKIVYKVLGVLLMKSATSVLGIFIAYEVTWWINCSHFSSTRVQNIKRESEMVVSG